VLWNLGGYSDHTMQSDRYLPDDGTLTTCTWCGAELGLNAVSKQSAAVFCSRKCEIEGHYWLYQEMCVIEITNPQQWSGDHCDSP
jgi:hypothetical protein